MIRGDFGAIEIESGLVRFRLWAPDADTVGLVIDGQHSGDMARVAEGVYELTIHCKMGATYKYLIDGAHAIPDPASRAQLSDVHDESVVTTSRYDWKSLNWLGRPWHESIVYEVHVGLMGGFKGVLEELPRLKSLGITAIELMPIADFPGRRNWGYDGVLPYAPDVSYGAVSDLRCLIDEAHSLGIQVFLDVVYNHFGPDGNYISSYARSFFDEAIHTPWGGAINFKVWAVRRYFIENAIYWLKDFRFDGLRFDAVHAINDDNFLLEMAAEIRETFRDRHIHLILENENNESALLNVLPSDMRFNAQWTDDWHHCVHVLLTRENEGYYEDFQEPAVQLAKCLAEGFAYQGQPSSHANGKPRGKPSAHLPLTAFLICLQNHDQIGNRAMGERLASLAGRDSLNAAIVLLLMTPQIPMIFMGEEWGETNPFLFFTDHQDKLADAVREGRRKEFAHFDAFRDPEKRERIPDPNAEATYKASALRLSNPPTTSQAEYLRLFQTALAARKAHITPYLSDVCTISAAPAGETGVFASWRLAADRTLTVAANFGDAVLKYDAPKGRLVFASRPVEEWDGYLPGNCCLAWIFVDG